MGWVLDTDYRGPVTKADTVSCPYTVRNPEPSAISHFPFPTAFCLLPLASCPRERHDHPNPARAGRLGVADSGDGWPWRFHAWPCQRAGRGPRAYEAQRDWTGRGLPAGCADDRPEREEGCRRRQGPPRSGAAYRCLSSPVRCAGCDPRTRPLPPRSARPMRNSRSSTTMRCSSTTAWRISTTPPS